MLVSSNVLWFRCSFRMTLIVNWFKLHNPGPDLTKRDWFFQLSPM